MLKASLEVAPLEIVALPAKMPGMAVPSRAILLKFYCLIIDFRR